MPRPCAPPSPSLIYCNLAAYGADGPLKNRPGYDPLMQAFGGLMSLTGEEGREPVRTGPSIIDQGSAMWAVIGILSALHRRAATGQGCEVGTSLYETALAWTNQHAANYLASGRVPGRMGSENFGICPYKAYQARDGWVVVAAGNNNLFQRLADALGHPEWPADARFKTNPDRVTNRDELNPARCRRDRKRHGRGLGREARPRRRALRAGARSRAGDGASAVRGGRHAAGRPRRHHAADRHAAAIRRRAPAIPRASARARRAH